MYLDPELTIEERWKVTKMMFGAQSDVHDYHKVNLSTNFILFNFSLIYQYASFIS